MNITSLDHLVLTVVDIDIIADFYVNILGMEKQVFGDNRIALKFGNQKINLHLLGSEFEPKAFNVKDGSADLCFIINTPLNEAKKHIESLGVKIEEGIVSRTGAMGEIESIYLRDTDKNLIELSNYKSK